MMIRWVEQPTHGNEVARRNTETKERELLLLDSSYSSNARTVTVNSQ